MIKHTQTIRLQKPTNCLRMFDHFMGLALKVLCLRFYWVHCKLFQRLIKERSTDKWPVPSEREMSNPGWKLSRIITNWIFFPFTTICQFKSFRRKNSCSHPFDCLEGFKCRTFKHPLWKCNDCHFFYLSEKQ